MMAMAADMLNPVLDGNAGGWREPSFDASLLDDAMIADTSMQDQDQPPSLLPSVGSQSGFPATLNPLSKHPESFRSNRSPPDSPIGTDPRSPTPPPPVVSSALDGDSMSAFRRTRFDSGSPPYTTGRVSDSSFRMPSPPMSSLLPTEEDQPGREKAAAEGFANPRSSLLSNSHPPGDNAPSLSSAIRSRALSKSSHIHPQSPSLCDKPSASPPLTLRRDRYAHLLRRPSDEPNGQDSNSREYSYDPILRSAISNRLSSGSEASGESHPHTHRPALVPHSRFTFETPRLTGEKRALRSSAAATASALRPSLHPPRSTPFRAKRVPVYVDPEEGGEQENTSVSNEDKENKATTPGDGKVSAPPPSTTADTGRENSQTPDRTPNSLKEVEVNPGSRSVPDGPEPRSGSHLPGYELGAGAEEDEADNEEQAVPIAPRQPSSASALSLRNPAVKVSRVNSAGVAELGPTPSQPSFRTGLAARAVSQPPAIQNEPRVQPLTEDSATLQSLPIEEATAVLARTSEQDKFGLYEREVLKEAERQATYDPGRIAQWLGKCAGKDWKDFKPTTVYGLKYRKIRKAGEGGFSTVWIVRGPYERVDTREEYAEHQQAFFAMKQVNLKKLEPQSREDVLKEAEHLEALSRRPDYDKYMLRYFAHRANDSHLKILIELGDCDFSDILRRQQLDRWEIPKTFGQMCEAVHFLHQAGIVHTDLKPANFLRAGQSIKIIDLGIAQKIPKGTIHISREALVGTPNYMAPETVKLSRTAAGGGGSAPRPAIFKAGIASDVWAMGCILYQLVYGRPPFDRLMGEAKLRAIVSEKTVIDFPPTRPPPYPAQPGDEGELVDDSLMDAMKAALQYHVVHRATLPDLLAHPFMAPYSRAGEYAAVSRDMMYLFFTRVRNLERAGRIVPGTEASMVENFFQKMPQSSGPCVPPPNPPSGG